MAENEPAHFKVGDEIRISTGRGPLEHYGRRGVITDLIPGNDECRIEFEDGMAPTTAYVKLRWLEHWA